MARAQTCAERQMPSPADKDTARGLMAEARQLREQGNMEGALEKFKAADGIMKVTPTAFEVAKTYASLGKLVEARDVLASMARIPECPDDPPPFVDARNNGRKLDEEIAPRVPSLRLQVKNAPAGVAAVVKVDNVQVPDAALTVPRKINPGHHVIVARAGTAEKTVEVDVAERETKDVLLDLPPQQTQQPPPPVVVEAPKSAFISKPVAFIALGVGGVGIAVGTVTGILAIGAKNNAEKGCVNKQCPPSTYSDLDKASTFSTISTIGFIVGVAGVGVGVVGLLTQPKEPDPAPPAKAGVTPAATSSARQVILIFIDVLSLVKAGLAPAH